MAAPYIKYFFLFLFSIAAGGLSAQNIIKDSVSRDTIETGHVKLLLTSEKTIISKYPAYDSLKVKLHSPKKAAWMSAVLPGLGQIYNKKYWKLSVIYVGFGLIGYLGYNYYTKFNKYKDTYMYRAGLDSSSRDYFPEITSKDLLYENWNFNRRNFELTCIVGSLLYILNILDASVDGHLYKFDISDDLSLLIEPNLSSYAFNNSSPTGGIKLTLRF